MTDAEGRAASETRWLIVAVVICAVGLLCVIVLLVMVVTSDDSPRRPIDERSDVSKERQEISSAVEPTSKIEPIVTYDAPIDGTKDVSKSAVELTSKKIEVIEPSFREPSTAATTGIATTTTSATTMSIATITTTTAASTTSTRTSSYMTVKNESETSSNPDSLTFAQSTNDNITSTDAAVVTSGVSSITESESTTDDPAQAYPVEPGFLEDPIVNLTEHCRNVYGECYYHDTLIADPSCTTTVCHSVKISIVVSNLTSDGQTFTFESDTETPAIDVPDHTPCGFRNKWCINKTCQLSYLEAPFFIDTNRYTQPGPEVNCGAPKCIKSAWNITDPKEMIKCPKCDEGMAIEVLKNRRGRRTETHCVACYRSFSRLLHEEITSFLKYLGQSHAIQLRFVTCTNPMPQGNQSNGGLSCLSFKGHGPHGSPFVFYDKCDTCVRNLANVSRCTETDFGRPCDYAPTAEAYCHRDGSCAPLYKNLGEFYDEFPRVECLL